jgi:hypothetical protein
MSEVPWDDIDQEIVPALHALSDSGIDTFSSCQGGSGHAAVMPEILFNGDDSAGLYAVWILYQQGFAVWEVSRHWTLYSDEAPPWSSFWRVTLRWLGGQRNL